MSHRCTDSNTSLLSLNTIRCQSFTWPRSRTFATRATRRSTPLSSGTVNKPSIQRSPLPGSGLRWIEGLLTVPDDKGVERLVARVANVRDLGHVNDWHLMVFNDNKEVFE